MYSAHRLTCSTLSDIDTPGILSRVVHKNLRIELIAKCAIDETTNYKSVFFERPVNFTFEAGDWIDLEHEPGGLSGGKTYSLSSSPTEDDLRITFKEGLSGLKRLLGSIEAGQKLYISQYGNDYDFQLRDNRSSVLIAGGVGIAPFRSMLKEMYDNKIKNDVTLIYLNQTNEFLFRQELDAWQAALPKLKVEYLETKALNRKKREKLLLSLIKDASLHYYVSGPPAMVESTEHLLLDNGIPLRNIRIDSFGGY